MGISERAKAYVEKMFPDCKSSLAKTDPEWIELFENFAFDEVVNQNDQDSLEDPTRFLSILAVLTGSQAVEGYRVLVPAAMNFGVKPVEIKEMIYQAVAYLGIGRVLPFLKATNEIFAEMGISLPLEGQATVTADTRLAKGEQAQIDIFGEGMRGFANAGPEESRHINRWLVDNCFGDYYTRRGLNDKQREMITFCFLAAQGGCEPQLISHAKANLRIGNDKNFLIQVISQCLPYIGYPRSLNALRCVNEAAKE